MKLWIKSVFWLFAVIPAISIVTVNALDNLYGLNSTVLTIYITVINFIVFSGFFDGSNNEKT